MVVYVPVAISKLRKIAEILQVPTLSLLDGSASYIIENGNELPIALHNSSIVTTNNELIEKLVASKDEIIFTQKEYIQYLKAELEKSKS